MKKIIIGIIVILIVLLGGYFLFFNKTPDTQNLATIEPISSQTQNSQQEGQQTGQVKANEVIYTDAGYAPAEITVKMGDTVVFKNESSQGMWTASANHPSHTIYSGAFLQQHCPDTSNTSLDECKSVQPGESWSFTFTKAGTWFYHNHVNSSKFGKVIVQ